MRVTLLVVILPLLVLARTPDLTDLVRQLGDEDFDVREKAAKLLTDRGEDAREILTRAARDSSDAEIRKRATDLLVELDRRAEQRALAEKLKSLKTLVTPTFDATSVKPSVAKQGVLIGRETWNADNSYHITADLVLGAGAELTIQPGTVVLVAEGAGIALTAGATLVARGEADRPIVFTCIAEKDGKDGHWGKFTGAGKRLDLAHVRIRRSSGVRLVSGCSAEWTGVGIFHTRGDALTLADSGSRLAGMTIRDATGVGLVVEGTYPNVTGATISRCNVGVLVKDGGYPRLTDLRLAEVTDAAIHIRDGSYPRLETPLVTDSGTGLRVEGGSYPRLSGLLVADARGDGIVIDGGSYPSLLSPKVSSAGGFGLVVTDGSYPSIGNFQALGCKKGDQQIDPTSRVRPPQPDDRR